MISSRDVSVVVQGPVNRGSPEAPYTTAEVLASIRRVLPEAELILSTWPGQDLDGLNADVLVQPADPGPAIMDASGLVTRKHHNVNRQMVSTAAGLRAATRPWAVKLRSDTRLEHDGLLRYLDQSAPRDPRWQIFSSRVVACEIGCLNPCKVPALFQVSDLFHAGRREDLLKLWDAPLAPEPETSQWLVGKPRPWVVWVPEGLFTRYNAEQYIWITCLNRQGNAIQLHHPGDAPRRLAWSSQCYFLNNFRPVPMTPLGIQLPPRLQSFQTANVHYTEQDWETLVATTIARPASLSYRLHYQAGVLYCRARYIWRDYTGRRPNSLLVRLVRGARKNIKPHSK